MTTTETKRLANLAKLEKYNQSDAPEHDLNEEQGFSRDAAGTAARLASEAAYDGARLAREACQRAARQ